MNRMTFLCFSAIVLLLCCAPAALGQTAQNATGTTAAHHAKKAPPKPEPTEPELFEYIRGKLLTLSPDDGINDNLEITLDSTGTIMTTTQPGGYCDQFLNNLDTNSLSWDIFDPSDSHNSRGELLRLTVVSIAGKPARTCYDKKGKVDPEATTNRIRLLFSLAKAEQIPGFQDKMTKAAKKFIVLAGGAPETKLF